MQKKKETKIVLLEKSDLMFGSTTNSDYWKNPIDVSGIEVK